MKETLLKLTVAATLLSGCAGESKDTPPIPTPPELTAEPTQPPTITPEFMGARLVLTYALEETKVRHTHTDTPTPILNRKK